MVVKELEHHCSSLFITFLAKNNILYKENHKTISNSTLVSLTLMIAESNPKEKDIMIMLTVNLMNI